MRSTTFGAVFARIATIGEPPFLAVNKAFRAKLYADGTKLLVRVSPWVMAAVVVRLHTMIAGRRPTDRSVV